MPGRKDVRAEGVDVGGLEGLLPRNPSAFQEDERRVAAHHLLDGGVLGGVDRILGQRDVLPGLDGLGTGCGHGEHVDVIVAAIGVE